MLESIMVTIASCCPPVLFERFGENESERFVRAALRIALIETFRSQSCAHGGSNVPASQET